MKRFLIFLGVLGVDVLLESAFYQGYLTFNHNLEILTYVDHVLRYALLRFGYSSIPYLLILIIYFKVLGKPLSDFSLSVVNLIANLLVVTFFRFLEGASMFDEKIFLFSLLASLMLLFLILKFKVISGKNGKYERLG